MSVSTGVVKNKPKKSLTPEERAERDLKPMAVMAMLVEYHEKVLKLKERIIELLKKSELDRKNEGTESERIEAIEREGIKSKFSRIEAAGRQLISHTSGLVEHSVLDPVTRLELRLRLAEFESELLTTGKAYHQLPTRLR